MFRNRERGALHHPEFTMLEWYRAEAPYEALMEDCAALLALAAESRRQRGASVGAGASADPFATPERLTVARGLRALCRRSISWRACRDGGPTRTALRRPPLAAGMRVAADDDWADIFSRVLVEQIEPVWASAAPTILFEYPVREAALARPKPADPRVAERFELYACGVELANGFGELTDPAEQRRRFEAEMAEKERIYGERYPIDEDFLAALAECRRRAASRWASIAWSCWRPAPPISIR